jgi:ABC-type transport system involved in multi-copper enzyme maturation permease subunit
LRVPAVLRGPYVVARQEFLVNLRSVRLLIMLIALALIVVGGAYGLGGLGRGGPTLTPFKGWGHPGILPTDEHVAVVWVSDPFGAPLADREVNFHALLPGGGTEDLGQIRTDPEGFARLPVGNRTEVGFEIRSGTIVYPGSIFWFLLDSANFTFAFDFFDLDGDGLSDDLVVHVMNREGAPVAARFYVNDTFVTSGDARLGFARLKMPPGPFNFTVEVDGERQTMRLSFNSEGPGRPFATGPDYVLFLIAGGFAPFVLPIFAIVITFDAISKERVQGTLDLLLSRPVSRAGALLGKLAGTFGAVAVPVTVVNVVGIGVLAAVSRKAPTWSFAYAFLGLSLLLIAFYVLLQLVLSTLAKTSGTAVLFGVLLWLAFNVLYPVVTLILSFVLFPNNFETQFRFLQLAVLGNPSQIYQQLIGFSAPTDIGSGFGQFGGTALDLPVVAAAAAAWLALLLALALWTFHRKAAD